MPNQKWCCKITLCVWRVIYSLCVLLIDPALVPHMTRFYISPLLALPKDICALEVVLAQRLPRVAAEPLLLHMRLKMRAFENLVRLQGLLAPEPVQGQRCMSCQAPITCHACVQTCVDMAAALSSSKAHKGTQGFLAKLRSAQPQTTRIHKDSCVSKPGFPRIPMPCRKTARIHWRADEDYKVLKGSNTPMRGSTGSTRA